MNKTQTQSLINEIRAILPEYWALRVESHWLVITECDEPTIQVRIADGAMMTPAGDEEWDHFTAKVEAGFATEGDDAEDMAADWLGIFHQILRDVKNLTAPQLEVECWDGDIHTGVINISLCCSWYFY